LRAFAQGIKPTSRFACHGTPQNSTQLPKNDSQTIACPLVLCPSPRHKIHKQQAHEKECAEPKIIMRKTNVFFGCPPSFFLKNPQTHLRH
jgi:hypothetical protein